MMQVWIVKHVRELKGKKQRQRSIPEYHEGFSLSESSSSLMPLFEGSLCGLLRMRLKCCSTKLRQSELYSGRLGFHVQFVHVWNVFLALKVADG